MPFEDAQNLSGSRFHRRIVLSMSLRERSVDFKRGEACDAVGMPFEDAQGLLGSWVPQVDRPVR